MTCLEICDMSCQNPACASCVISCYVLSPPTYADMNPLHWGGSNSLAVGLGAAVYIWNAETGSINELHQLPFPGSYVTSLQWDARGRYLAIGTSDAAVQVSGALTVRHLML